jgi:predicted kinase
MVAMLIALTGLPGTGKTMLAEALGVALSAAVVSVDPIEAAMRRAGIGRDQPTGLAAYSVAGAVVEGQLRLGADAVVDAVNAAAQARAMWQALADEYGHELRVIEVVCRDEALHRRRVSSRMTVAGLPAPGWAEVRRQRTAYRPWPLDRLELDSAEEFERNLRIAVRHLSR